MCNHDGILLILPAAFIKYDSKYQLESPNQSFY